jgi:uncharacterized membrane protein
MTMTTAVLLHILATIVWIGGMFFAILVLRPAAGALEPPERLALWRRVFARFFPWVWIAVAVLLATGYWMIFEGFAGFANLPLHVNLMHGIGWLMVLIYGHLWFVPYKRFKAALDAGETPVAAAHLNQIRWIVTTNLALGLITAVIGASGRYWA